MESMDIKPPYLEAIQAINGKTPGQKHKSVNKIAAEIAKRAREGEDFVKLISSLDVPEALVPLIRIEAAIILKDHDGVVDALRNEDSVVSSQALNAKWFFHGTNKTIFNVDYFDEHLFPHISLRTRSKVIRNMAMYLKDTAVAQTFFIEITKKYGVGQATPLLLACDEKFIIPVIVERMIILTPRLLSELYFKYPAVAVEYLKLAKRDDSVTRNIHRIDIDAYSFFLPALMKKHLDSFIEIHEEHSASERLSKTRTRLFLRSSVQKLLNDPKLWLRILSMKVVSDKLTREQFEAMFKKLLPEEKSEFHFDGMLSYLEHFEENEKLSMVLDAFEKVYGESLLDNEDKVTKRLMKMLPTDERVKQARIKLENDKNWRARHGEASWRCFLTTSESVPAIKNQISITSDACERSGLLKQLVLTCQINDDKDALLDILKYFVVRHNNEEQWVRYRFLEDVMTSFDLPKLSAEYWSVLNDCIKKGHVRNEFEENKRVVKKLLEGAIHHNFLNGLPIDKEIDWIIEMESESWYSDWNIVQECPEIERKCLCMFLERIPKRYAEDQEYWKNHGEKLVECLTRCIYDFDSRSEKVKSTLERISIKDYAWLLEKCRAVVYDKTNKNDYRKDKIIEILRANEKDLYDLWVRDTKAIEDYVLEDILDILVKEPERILEDWKAYLRNAQKSMPSTIAKLFVKKSQWYQDIPMKFVDQCLADIKDTKNVKTFITLSLLLDGATFTKVIEPYLPTGPKVDTSSENARGLYRIMATIPDCINLVNPPVSLDVIERYCVGDFLQLAMRSLTSVSRRVSSTKVISLAESLVDRRASVKKHGIRLVCLVASLEEMRIFLNDSWKVARHRSIREVLFSKIYDFFRNNPDQQSWKMMEECIVGLTKDDDDSIFYRLLSLECIPNEYVTSYVKLLFGQISALEQNGYDAGKCLDMECNLLSNITSSISSQLPEDYCEVLLTKYLFSFDSKPKLTAAGERFAINSYIVPAGDKLELRLNFFAEHFKKCVKKHWDAPHPKIFGYYPMNVMVHSFIRGMTSAARFKKIDMVILERLLDLFVSIVSPVEDLESYLVLIFTIEFQRSNSPKDFGARIGRKVSDLIETFSPESVMTLADRLHDFILSQCRMKDSASSELTFSTIQALLELGTIHPHIIAARLLANVEEKTFGERYRDVIRVLLKRKHPGITSILYTYRSTFHHDD